MLIIFPLSAFQTITELFQTEAKAFPSGLHATDETLFRDFIIIESSLMVFCEKRRPCTLKKTAINPRCLKRRRTIINSLFLYKYSIKKRVCQLEILFLKRRAFFLAVRLLMWNYNSNVKKGLSFTKF